MTERIGGNTLLAAAGMVALAVAMGIGRFAATPMLPMMIGEQRLDVAGGGLLASVHFLGYLAGALAGAWVRVSPRRMFAFALGGIAAGTAAMGLSDALPIWLAARFVCGVLSAWVLMLVSRYLVSAVAADGRTMLQGWIFGGVGAGVAFSGMACLLFMAAGWSSAAGWLWLAGASLAASIAVFRVCRASMPDISEVSGTVSSARRPLEWRAVIAYGTMGLGYIVPATYLPLMAQQYAPSPLVFGWAWPIFGLAALVSTPVAIRLLARWSNRQVWAAGHLLMAAGLLLPAFGSGLAVVILAGLCVGGTFMVVTMTGMREANRLAPPGDAMRHIGVLTASFAAGQMVGPVAAGLIHQATGSFSQPLMWTGVALVATAFLVLPEPRSGQTGQS